MPIGFFVERILLETKGHLAYLLRMLNFTFFLVYLKKKQ